jgi:hypothetical protein
MNNLRSSISVITLMSLIVTPLFAAPPGSSYLPNETLNPGCAPGDINCIVENLYLTGELDPIFTLSPAFWIGTWNISNWNSAFGWGNHATQGYLTGWSLPSSNNWILGWSVGWWFALGSTDSILPFMSNGNIKMQLSDSNLSLSNNASFVDTAGRNGLFIGNNNTYGDSENVLWVWETLDIRNGNKNIFTIGNQVDHIETNTNSFFAGEELSGVSNNNNVLAFGNRNTINSNTDSILFGLKNNWSSEMSKFIVGNNDKKWFQVDMDNGEVYFGGNPGSAGQYLSSNWAGSSPSWQNFPSFTSINTLNGLITSTQTFALSQSSNDFIISSTGWVHTFYLPDASPSARWLVTIGVQSFTGAKTFTVNPVFSSMTFGSIPFIGTSGLLSQNNSRLFWDNTNNQLLTFSWWLWSAPTYSFFGDPDTGMYHPWVNILGFSAGWNVVGRMTNVGWSLWDGSMTPVSLVHIGGGANPATFRMTNTTSSNTVNDGFFINFTGSGVSMTNKEAFEMSFGTNNTEQMRITASGNLALGQTSAVERLEVNGGVKIWTSSTTCNTWAAGVIRYNTATSKHEWCNGTAWTALY